MFKKKSMKQKKKKRHICSGSPCPRKQENHVGLYQNYFLNIPPPPILMCCTHPAHRNNMIPCDVVWHHLLL